MDISAGVTDIYAEVLEEASEDPCYRLVFKCISGKEKIERGYAEVIRRSPKPVITLGSNTEARFSGVDRDKLELELLNAVVRHIIRSGMGIGRTYKGNLRLQVN